MCPFIISNGKRAEKGTNRNTESKPFMAVSRTEQNEGDTVPG